MIVDQKTGWVLQSTEDVPRNSYLKIKRKTCQKQPIEVFYKKVVLKDFAKFTGKHLC